MLACGIAGRSTSGVPNLDRRRLGAALPSDARLRNTGGGLAKPRGGSGRVGTVTKSAPALPSKPAATQAPVVPIFSVQSMHISHLLVPGLRHSCVRLTAAAGTVQQGASMLRCLQLHPQGSCDLFGLDWVAPTCRGVHELEAELAGGGEGVAAAAGRAGQAATAAAARALDAGRPRRTGPLQGSNDLLRG